MVDSAYRPAQRFSTIVAGKEFILETGKLAEQAGGAVTARVGDTMLFAAATMSKSMRENIDFFPLSVDFEEKLYAAGRIPGSFFRREGRPPESAITFSAQGVSALAGIVACGGSIWCSFSVTSCAKDVTVVAASATVIAASAAAPARMGVNLNIPVSSLGLELLYDKTFSAERQLVTDRRHAGLRCELLETT